MSSLVSESVDAMVTRPALWNQRSQLQLKLRGIGQQLLNDVVVGLRPMPAGAQLPSVHDIADQINGVGIMVAKEIEQLLGLACARAQMHVGNEQRANTLRRIGRVHDAEAHQL
jgi:hypothetical protein